MFLLPALYVLRSGIREEEKNSGGFRLSGTPFRQKLQGLVLQSVGVSMVHISHIYNHIRILPLYEYPQTTIIRFDQIR